MIIIKISHSTKFLSQNRRKKGKSTPLSNKYMTVHFSGLVLNKPDLMSNKPPLLVKCRHASGFFFIIFLF